MQKKKSNQTSDTYVSEGMTIGVIVGVVLFFCMLLVSQASYGALLFLVCVVAGMLGGLSRKKEAPKSPKEEEIARFKQMDKKQNNFFMEGYNFDPLKKRPVIRTNLYGGEKVAGFLDKTSGRFEEVMLVRSEKDLKDFCRMYGIKDITSVEEDA